MKPPTRGSPPPRDPPPMPGMTADRPLSPCALAFPHGAEAQDVVREPGGHGHARVDDRTELPGRLEAARVPIEVQAQRVVHLGDADTGEAGRRVHRAGIRRDAVDVVAGEPRVVDRLEARIEREVERIAMQAPAHLGLADDR